jgi:hypothetical protein
MIHFIYGEYELEKNDFVISEITSASINKNFMTKDKNLVAYSDELNLKKKDIDLLIESGVNLTIVIHDYKLLKGKRASTKKYKITKLSEDTQKDVNPFELVKYVFSCNDRELLYNYLKDTKNSLYVLMMIFSCNYPKFKNKANQEVTEWLCKNYYRVKYEVVCAKIAFEMKCEQIWRFDWLYPKKKEEEES